MANEIEKIKQQLPLWIAAKQNILAIGPHGVGKTSLLKWAAEQANLNYRYFSAPTMDPWTDFVGVPRAVERPDGSNVLELIRPQQFEDDIYDLLIFDELNRAPKKVRNAVMEIIQFQSINGRKFKRLSMVWGIINPEEEEDAYDVERLDPAQRDRFEQHVIFPNECCVEYFIEKYSGQFSETAIRGGIEWWNKLTPDIKKKVSPRRLDYAFETFGREQDLRFVLHESTNVGKLITLLRTGSVEDQLKLIMKNKNMMAAEKYLANDNNYSSAIDIILKSNDMIKFFTPVIENERLSQLVTENSKVKDFVAKNVKHFKNFEEVGLHLATSRAGKISGELMNYFRMMEPDDLPDSMKHMSEIPAKPIEGIVPAVYANAYPKRNADFQKKMEATVKNLSGDICGTDERNAAYTEILANIPKEMNKEEVAVAMKVMSIIGGGAHHSSLRKDMPQYLGILNHICTHMKQQAETEIEESVLELDDASLKQNIMRKYGDMFKKIMGKLQKGKMKTGFMFNDWFPNEKE